VPSVLTSDLIKGSLRLIGVIQEGETPSSDMMNDALSSLNGMLESWSLERLASYATQDQIFTWPAATATRTIGPAGNFVGNRPFTIDDSTYFKDVTSGVSYGLRQINQGQYNGIALKTATSTFPQYLWVNYTNPAVEMTVWPVPSRSLEFHIVSVLELTQPATIATTLYLPPGYARAYRYNLALELCPEYGVEPAGSVIRGAIASKRNIKRVNQDDSVMSMPVSLLNGPGRYNIYSGNY